MWLVFYYKWTLRSYTACQTGGEIDKVSWYSFSWWIGVVTMESILWSKLLLTSWVCVSGQVEYLSATDNTVGVRETFFVVVWAGVDLEMSPLLRTESNWPIVMTTFLIIMGFAEALVTVQSPSLPKRWQHWVTEKDLAASTSVARWLVLPRCEDFFLIHPKNVFWLWSKLLNETVTLRARTGCRWLLARSCWSWDSSIHIPTNEVRAQEWRRDAERKKREGEIDRWEAK